MADKGIRKVGNYTWNYSASDWVRASGTGHSVNIVDSSGNIVDTFGADPVGIKDASDVRINPLKEDGEFVVLSTTNKDIRTGVVAVSGALDTVISNQLADGHNVTVDNASGGSAVNIQDGGNTITVDGTVISTPTGTQDVQGVDAEDAAVTADPVHVGGRYDSTARTLETGDAGGIAVDVAGNTQVREIQIGLDGTGTQAVTDLTSANTFYAIPSTQPTEAYQLRLQFRGTGDFYLTFENGGTAGTSGILYNDKDIVDFVLAPDDLVYVATKTAGDDVNWIAKEVV